MVVSVLAGTASRSPSNNWEPLCGTPFSQIARDRRCRSYGFSQGEVRRFPIRPSTVADALIILPRYYRSVRFPGRLQYCAPSDVWSLCHFRGDRRGRAGPCGVAPSLHHRKLGLGDPRWLDPTSPLSKRPATKSSRRPAGNPDHDAEFASTTVSLASVTSTALQGSMVYPMDSSHRHNHCRSRDTHGKRSVWQPAHAAIQALIPALT